MKRSLFFCMVALLAGVYMAYFVPDIIPVLFLFFLLLVFFVSLFFSKRGRVPFFMVLFFLLGAFYLQEVNDITKRPLYPYVNEYVTIYADAITEPVYDEADEQYTLQARVRSLSFLKEHIQMEERVQMTLKKGEPIPQFGETFTAVCLFYEPRETMNRGGFDYALYLKSRQIFFAGTAENGTVSITGHFSLSLADRLYQLNRLCARRLTQQFPGDSATVFQAIALGDKTNMQKDMSEKLQISGLSHVTAVSGAHVTALVSMLYILLKLFNRGKHKYIWFIGGMILFFMLFTGATPSVVRASVMGIFMLLAYVCLRRADSLTSLSVAAGILVLYHPLVALDAGFILSFGATLGILLFADPIIRSFKRLFHLEKQKNSWSFFCTGIISVIAVTISSQLLMLPLISWLYGSLSPWGIITSLLTVLLLPVILIGGLLVSGLSFIHPLLAKLLACFAYPFVKMFLMIVQLFGQKPDSLLTVGSFSLFGVYCYILGLFIFYCLLHKRWQRCLVPAISLSVLLCIQMVFIMTDSETAEITFINVGQGDCTLLELPEGTDILIDGGGVPSYQGDFDVGKQIVLPYLRKAGISQLDYMIASHPHTDHMGGLLSLLDYIEVETVLVPPGFDLVEEGAAFLEKATHKGAVVQTISAGESVTFSTHSALRALMPDEQWLSVNEHENNGSLVLWFHFFNNTALFTGDIEAEAEQQLVMQELPQPGVQILKVAHHGGANGTTETFLNWAKPQYAYIPCGTNSFGHPSDEVLNRLTAHETVVYRADRDKDVTFLLDKTGIRSIRKGGAAYDED